jgi:hypothetical protein
MRAAETRMESGFPDMYYVDNPKQWADNLERQVSNRVDPCSSAAHDRNLNSARFAPVETVGGNADSKTLGGTVSVSSQGYRQMV